MKYYTLLIFFIASNFSFAQRLYFYQANDIPVTVDSTLLQNAWSGGMNAPLWSGIDMNGDGRTDLYMYDRTNGRVLTFINDGSTNYHAFHDSSTKYAPLFPQVYTGGINYTPGWGLCHDYNCDGKPDFFTLSPVTNCKCMALYKNEYTTANGLQWSLVTNEIDEKCNSFTNAILTSSILIPAFVDMDDDGDLDILGFNNQNADNHLFYHKNYAMEHFGRCDTFDFQLDTKCWGNFAFSTSTNEVACFHCPLVPTLTCPAPEPEKSYHGDSLQETLATIADTTSHGLFSAERDDTITSLLCLDLDGNGLKDILVGDVANSNCLMVHNNGTLQVAEMDTEDIYFPSYNTSIKDSNFVYSSYVDVDNDGKNDLIASSKTVSDKNNIWVYKNNGTNAAPIFNFQRRDFIVGEMIDEGEAADPVLFDYDADGLQDLIIAYGVAEQQPTSTIRSKLALYKNIGDSTHPQFQFITDNYMDIGQYSLANPICVTFGDLRCVGVKDMIIGDAGGNLNYFQNTSSAGHPANFPSPPLSPYMGIDVGNNAAPQLYDLDGDGKLDLVVGQQLGKIKYFHNTGTCSAPNFSNVATNAALGNVSVVWGGVYGFSVPYVYKNNGVTEMLVSNDHGIIYYYNNIDGNLSGTFNKVDSFINGSLGIRTDANLTVSGGDLNNDGIEDMLVGLYSGGAQIFYGSHFGVGVGKTESKNSFVCFPNPANTSIEISGYNQTPGTRIEVYTILGEKIYNRTITTGNTSLGASATKSQTVIDVSSFAAGLYIVAISSSAGYSYQKLLVSH